MKYVKPLIGALLSAVAIFMWGFIFWTLIPAPSWGLQPLPEDELALVNEALRRVEPGTYVTVGVNQIEGETEAQLSKRFERGPLAYVSVDPDGASAMQGKTLFQGFLHALVASLLMGFLLMLARPSLPDYFERVKFVSIAGLVGTLWTQPGYTIWFFRDCGTSTYFIIYDIVAWFLAGLILAFFIAGKKPIRCAPCEPAEQPAETPGPSTPE